MKFLVFGIALVIAGAAAFPDIEGYQSEGEVFADNFRRALEAIQRYIVNNNLDPLAVQRHDRHIARFPYLNIHLFIQGLNLKGLSNIVIHSLDYSNVFSRFRLDVELPEIDFSLEDAGFSGAVVSRNVSAKFGGKLKISNIRLNGEAYVQPNLVGGPSNITSVDAKFSLGGLTSDLVVEVLENNHSEWLNNLLNVRIPNFLKNNENDINRVLSSVIRRIAQFYLNNRPRPSF
ncbi:unnamed protein product [Leptosia nina]|uniref:Uncharacterized protein n=1 Tax=Leptosia nina TaxID=320188 RepID=A0AAV1JGR3_9NEOP